MILADERILRAPRPALRTILITCAMLAIAAAPTAQAGTQSQMLRTEGALDGVMWAAPHNISNSPDVDSQTPALAVTDSGAAHIVWVEGDRLFHSHQVESTWSEPSVILGTGTSEQPALEAGPHGKLHLVYLNLSLSDPDIFYVTWNGSDWSLPKNVSQTSQVSDSPDIAVAPDGSIHVVAVERTTSGRRLYYATSMDGSSWPVYTFIPSAYGAAPSVDVRGEDGIHVAYRDETEDDIYTLTKADTSWSLPQNVSNTPIAPSKAPDLALDSDGLPELVWQESISETDQVRFTQIEGSIAPPTLSSSTSGARSPSLVMDVFGHRHVAWEDEAFPFAIRHTWTSDPEAWPTSNVLYASTLSLRDVVLGIGSDGTIHAAWAEIQDGRGEILYASEQLHEISHVFLPLAVRGP